MKNKHVKFEICKDSTFTLKAKFVLVNINETDIIFEQLLIMNLNKIDILVYHFMLKDNIIILEDGSEIVEKVKIEDGNNTFERKLYFTLNNVEEVDTMYWNDEDEPTIKDIEFHIGKHLIYRPLKVDKINNRFIQPRQGGGGGVVGMIDPC
jgi:hypothetical protein